MSPKLRITLLASIGLLALVLGYLVPAITRPSPPSNQPVQTLALDGRFNLIDETGQPVTQDSYLGRFKLVYFGFTYCPDVCPMTLSVKRQALANLLPSQRQKVVPVMVTVDPERDTPEQLKTYLSLEAFPDGVVGLTGSPEQIEQVAKSYYVYYRKSGEGPDYTIDHSTAAYLMDPQGRFNRVLAYGLSPDEMARLIRTAMQEG